MFLALSLTDLSPESFYVIAYENNGARILSPSATCQELAVA